VTFEKIAVRYTVAISYCTPVAPPTGRNFPSAERRVYSTRMTQTQFPLFEAVFEPNNKLLKISEKSSYSAIPKIPTALVFRFETRHIP